MVYLLLLSMGGEARVFWTEIILFRWLGATRLSGYSSDSEIMNLMTVRTLLKFYEVENDLKKMCKPLLDLLAEIYQKIDRLLFICLEMNPKRLQLSPNAARQKQKKITK